MWRRAAALTLLFSVAACGGPNEGEQASAERVERDQVTLNCRFVSPEPIERYGRQPQRAAQPESERQGAFSISIQLEYIENPNDDEDDDPPTNSIALIHQLDGFADPTIAPLVRNYLAVSRNNYSIIVEPGPVSQRAYGSREPTGRLVINRASLSLDIRPAGEDGNAPVTRDGNCTQETWIPIPEPQL